MGIENETMHHELILNQFGPLQRRGLMTWFLENQVKPRPKPYHQAFLNCLVHVSTHPIYRRVLDLQTKIGFTLLYEFGLELANKRIYHHLIHAVSKRMKHS